VRRKLSDDDDAAIQLVEARDLTRWKQAEDRPSVRGERDRHDTQIDLLA